MKIILKTFLFFICLSIKFITVNGQSQTQVFFDAAKSGDLDILVATTQKELINQKDSAGNTSLIYACANGHEEIVKHLISNSAEINLKSDKGITPLFAASYNGHLRIVELLVENNAIVDESSTSDSITSLAAASGKGYIEIIKVLLNAGANIRYEDSNGKTPNDYANNYNQAATLAYLDSALLEIYPAGEQMSDIFESLKPADYNTISHLLSKGAVPDILLISGATPLQKAFELLLPAIMDSMRFKPDLELQMLEHMANSNTDRITINGKKYSRDEVKEIVIKKQKPRYAPVYTKDIIKLLIDYHADPNFPNKDGLNLLQEYVENYSAYTFSKYQLKYQKHDTKYISKDERIAVANQHQEIIDFLITKGADINLTYPDGTTLLQKSVEKRYNSITEMLLDKGADISIKYSDGKSLLEKAIENNDYHTCKILLKNGADIQYVNNRITLAETGKDLKKLLEENGASFKIKKK